MASPTILTLKHSKNYFLNHFHHKLKFTWKFKNYSSNIVQKEFKVPTFCDISVDLSCNVRIKPLNVHTYSNSNLLVIQMDKQFADCVEPTIDGNQIMVKDIFKNGQENKDILCSIKAPVKANLDLRSQKNITVGYFQGDKLKAQSQHGDILIDRFQGISCQAFTNAGNITLKNYLQATDISAKTEKGSIHTGRLQGLNLYLEAKSGDLNIESSYCDNNEIKVGKGNLGLHNIHRNCSIIVDHGNLYLTGFDGTLKACILNGSAEIFLSRLVNTSEIVLRNNNTLSIKIADTCYNTSHFSVNAKNIKLDPSIEADAKKLNANRIIFSPKEKIEGNAIINCFDGNVNIETCSWQDMILMKLKNQ